MAPSAAFIVIFALLGTNMFGAEAGGGNAGLVGTDKYEQAGNECAAALSDDAYAQKQLEEHEIEIATAASDADPTSSSGSQQVLTPNEEGLLLVAAAKNGDLVKVKKLLAKKGVQVNFQNSDGKTPLIMAAEFSQLKIVVELLNTQHIKVDLRNNAGKTAYLVAAQNCYGKSEIVVALQVAKATTTLVDQWNNNAKDLGPHCDEALLGFELQLCSCSCHTTPEPWHAASAKQCTDINKNNRPPILNQVIEYLATPECCVGGNPKGKGYLAWACCDGWVEAALSGPKAREREEAERKKALKEAACKEPGEYLNAGEDSTRCCSGKTRSDGTWGRSSEVSCL